MEKPTDSEQAEKARQSIWRRDTEANDMREELERVRLELERTSEHVREVESKCDEYENMAHSAETRYRDAVRNLREVKAEMEAIKSAHGGEGLMANYETPSDLPAARDALVSRILEGKHDGWVWILVGWANVLIMGIV